MPARRQRARTARRREPGACLGRRLRGNIRGFPPPMGRLFKPLGGTVPLLLAASEEAGTCTLSSKQSEGSAAIYALAADPSLWPLERARAWQRRELSVRAHKQIGLIIYRRYHTPCTLLVLRRWLDV